MSENRASGNKWTEPGSLLGVAGFVSMVFMGYQNFTNDTDKRLADLSERLARLEVRAEERRASIPYCIRSGEIDHDERR